MFIPVGRILLQIIYAPTVCKQLDNKMSPLRCCSCAAIVSLITIFLLQLLICCSAEQEDACASAVDIDAKRGFTSNDDFALKIVGDVLSKNSLLYVVRYFILNVNASAEHILSLQLLLVNVCNDEANADCANSTVPAATYIGSRSAHHAALGPMTWDFLTLGAMDAAERANVTSIILSAPPAPPCQGSEEEVYVKTFRGVSLHAKQNDAQLAKYSYTACSTPA